MLITGNPLDERKAGERWVKIYRVKVSKQIFSQFKQFSQSKGELKWVNFMIYSLYIFSYEWKWVKMNI